MTLPLTSRSLELATVWRDYRPHAASWMNSVMVHALVLTALILPFTGRPLPQSSGADHQGEGWRIVRLYLPPHLARLAGNALNTGGGGGGGDRSLLPASRGPIPRFSETPLAPPSADGSQPQAGDAGTAELARAVSIDAARHVDTRAVG